MFTTETHLPAGRQGEHREVFHGFVGQKSRDVYGGDADKPMRISILILLNPMLLRG